MKHAVDETKKKGKNNKCALMRIKTGGFFVGCGNDLNSGNQIGSWDKK